MDLAACLPESLRGPSTTLTRIARGLSGAGVYRVEAGGQAYVLKVGAPSAGLAFHRLAADAGLAPRVVHHDETRRAVVTVHVADRGFVARLADPGMIDLLGQTLRRVHALPLPPSAVWRDPREVVAPVWAELADFALPGFARSAIDRVRAEPPPPRVRPRVTSHNDPNPSNLVFDGQRLLLLDWDAAGPNDPFYDLAAVALFLRLDDAATARLIAAHDDAPPAAVPDDFRYLRRLVAALCATMGFHVARRLGHPGGDARPEDAPTLAGVYAGLGAGTLTLGSPEGLWAFALALIHTI